MQKNGEGVKTLTSCQGDATNLSTFDDESFDITLVLGPMYHLYESQDVNKAIDEAVRVTKKNGVIMFAFLSVYAIMYSNYLYSNWAVIVICFISVKKNKTCTSRKKLLS